jgi:hypothetical protein
MTLGFYGPLFAGLRRGRWYPGGTPSGLTGLATVRRAAVPPELASLDSIPLGLSLTAVENP